MFVMGNGIQYRANRKGLVKSCLSGHGIQGK